MPNSKRSKEGYLLIDHRDSPGMADEAMVKAGMPVGAGRGVFESATITCSHCQRVVVLNPLRTRDRGWCCKCDAYLCDWCYEAFKQTNICKPFVTQVVDEFMDAAAKGVVYDPNAVPTAVSSYSFNI